MPEAVIPVVTATPVTQMAPMAAGGMTAEQFLMSTPGVILKQSIDIAEMAMGCSQQNQYWVYPFDNSMPYAQQADGMLRSAPVLKVKEESECLQRQCCGAQRELQFHVFDARYGQQTADIATMHKPNNFCENPCCRRGEVETVGPSGEVLSYARDPWRCCDITSVVKSKKGGEKWFTVKGSVFQMGLLCGCPCSESCVRVEMEVTDAKGVGVGSLNKEFGGLGREACTPAETFSVIFPPDATYAQRIGLISSMLLLHVTVFEARRKQNSGGGGGGA